MRLVIPLTGTLFIAVNAHAEDKKDKPTIPAFPVYYAMVSHVLKHDEGCFDQLMASPQMENISEFWWGYISKECDGYLSNQIEKLVKQSDSTKSQSKRNEEIGHRVDGLKQQCAMSVIFDNWERINASIVRNPQQECVAKKK